VAHLLRDRLPILSPSFLQVRQFCENVHNLPVLDNPQRRDVELHP
jgi:hypothetical protein